MPEQPALSEPVFNGDSRELAGTDVVAALNAPLNRRRNTIWAAAFETAWRKLETDVIGGPIRLDRSGVTHDALRHAPTLPDDTLPDESRSAAHYVDAHNIAEVQAELDEALAGYLLPSVPLEPNSLLAYAVMKAWVPFALPYLDFERPLEFQDGPGKSTPVRSFGLWDKYIEKIQELRAQPRLLYADYMPVQNHQRHAREFIVDLFADSAPCQIVIACVAPGSTLAGTLGGVGEKIKRGRNAREFDCLDILQVPEIAFGIAHNFSDLAGANLLGTRFDRPYIKTALEGIRFQLDRNGAYVDAAAVMVAACSGIMTTNHYVADRPFLIYIKNRASQHPFFVMWVGNAELIRKW